MAGQNRPQAENAVRRWSRAPIACSATLERRTFTFEVGKIAEFKHRPLIRSRSLGTGYGLLDHPASVNRLAIRCLFPCRLED